MAKQKGSASGCRRILINHQTVEIKEAPKCRKTRPILRGLTALNETDLRLQSP